MKKSSTILIPKSASADHVIYRIFTGLIADRLIKIAPSFLHHSQRGFLKVDDDLTILAPSRSALLEMSHPLTNWCSLFRMKLNFEKCALLELNLPSSKEPFYFAGGNIRSLETDDFYKYLGIRISKSNVTTSQGILSLLAPHHALNLIKLFIIPKFMHMIRLSRGKKLILNNFDTKLRGLLRDAFDLPSTSNSPLFYSPTHRGGLGLIELSKDVDLVEALRIVKILNNKSSYLASLLDYRIRLSRRSLNGEINSSSPVADLLNSPCVNAPPLSTLGINSNISRLLKLGLKFITLSSGLISISFPSYFRNPFPDVPISLKLLRKFASCKAVEEWQANKYQGNSQRCFGAYAESNDFIRSGSLPPKLYKWALKARLDLLPTKPSLKYRKLFHGDVTCRLCGSAPETLAHILNGCVMSKSSGQLQRHNEILNIISSSLNPNPFSVKRINLVYPFGQSKLRPDLLILNNQGLYDILLDVVVSFDNTTFHNAAAKEKIDKYSSLCSSHLKETGRSLLVLPFVVGSLGSITPHCLRALDSLPIAKENHSNILKR
ncbi:hypothetical protein MXB_4356, partial [Myxobolus squamalis]